MLNEDCNYTHHYVSFYTNHVAKQLANANQPF